MKLPPALALPARVGWRDHVVGAALAALYVAWLLPTARVLGFPRDESVYFSAASSYVGWWRLFWEQGKDALRPNVIDAAWTINAEHPALMKTLFGLSHWLLHEKWQVFADASTAYRFPGMCMGGIALWTTYLFGARVWGRRAGITAAVLLALVPHVFFHSHLACFDVPIMTMWLLCIYAYWRALDRGGVGWVLAAGVVYGLTLETKHNAWMMPAVFVPHALFVAAAHFRALPRGLRWGRVPVPWSLIAMATLGPLVFYALWPRLWTETRANLEWYVNFHLNHEYYTIEYLHRNYFEAPSPRSYLPVMTLATVPTVTLLLFGAGAVDRARVAIRRLHTWATRLPSMQAPSTPEPLETDLLVALAIGVAIGPFFLPKTPIFGGTKHWLTAYPFVAMLAGRGFDLAATAMKAAWPAASAQGRAWAAQGALFACVVAAPLAETVHSHPFGLSAYAPLVGGTAGGADLGLNRQFWGFTTQTAAAEYLNPEAPPGAPVFIDDTTWGAWAEMQHEERVRPDLRAVGSPGDAQIALVQHELHMNAVDYGIWVAFGTDAPVHVVTHDGVPIVSVYRRP